MFFRCDGGCGAEKLLVFTGDGWLVVAIDGATMHFCCPECLRDFYVAQTLITSAEPEAGL